VDFYNCNLVWSFEISAIFWLKVLLLETIVSSILQWLRIISDLDEYKELLSKLPMGKIFLHSTPIRILAWSLTLITVFLDPLDPSIKVLKSTAMPFCIWLISIQIYLGSYSKTEYLFKWKFEVKLKFKLSEKWEISPILKSWLWLNSSLRITIFD